MAHIVSFSTSAASRKSPYEGRIYEDGEVAEPTSEIRQVGPVDNGIVRYAGSFPTRDAAVAAVQDYFASYRLRMGDGSFIASPK